MSRLLTDEAGRDTLACAGWSFATSAFVGDPHPSISGLFGSSRPSAVARFIEPIVVDSIKRKSWRTATHVRQERAEVVSPTLTDSDSTAAVSFEGGVHWIRATSLHAAPARVFSSVGGAVGEAFEAHARTPETSAGDSLPSTKAHLSDVFDGSTGATASPRSEWFRPRIRQGKNGQTTECLSGKIKWHSVTVAQTGTLA